MGLSLFKRILGKPGHPNRKKFLQCMDDVNDYARSIAATVRGSVWTQSTSTTMLKKCATFCTFMINRHGVTPRDITNDMMNDWIKHMTDKTTGKTTTLAANVRLVTRFIKFLFKSNRIKSSVLPIQEEYHLAQIIVNDNTKKFCVKNLFDIRRYSKIPASVACYIELAVSTGFRYSEISTLRACDINFDEIPIDLSTGKKSKYCGGSISINPVSHKIKRNRSRKAYFSVASARIIRKWAIMKNIDMNSTVPILPITKPVVHNMINNFIKENPHLFCEEKLSEERTAIRRDFSDVDITSIQDTLLRISMEKAINRNQKLKKELEGLGFNKRQRNVVKKFSIGTHQYRRINAMLIYTRSFSGKSHDLANLMRLLGHRDQATTMLYLDLNDSVISYRDWAKVMLGSPSDYSQVRLVRHSATAKNKEISRRRYIKLTGIKMKKKEQALKLLKELERIEGTES